MVEAVDGATTGLVLLEIWTVGGPFNTSSESIVRVTISPCFARLVTSLFDAMDTVISGLVLSTVTVDPSVVFVRLDAPTL